MGGRKIGEAEEGYFEQLTPGDTFIFAGQVWRYNSLVGADAFVSPAPNDDPKMPSWGGSKFPLSTYLASRVRQMMHDEREWTALPPDVQEWLAWQKIRSAKDEAERNILHLQNRVKYVAVSLAPLPVLLLGLGVLAIRAGRENLGANPNRVIGH